VGHIWSVCPFGAAVIADFLTIVFVGNHFGSWLSFLISRVWYDATLFGGIIISGFEGIICLKARLMSFCGGLGFFITDEIKYRNRFLFLKPLITQNIRNIRAPTIIGGIKAFTVANQIVSVPVVHARNRTRTTHPQDMRAHIRNITRCKFTASHSPVF
jgi:hypothetical protein